MCVRYIHLCCVVYYNRKRGEGVRNYSSSFRIAMEGGKSYKKRDFIEKKRIWEENGN